VLLLLLLLPARWDIAGGAILCMHPGVKGTLLVSRVVQVSWWCRSVGGAGQLVVQVSQVVQVINTET
jgi:hypothetical protein